MYLVKSNATTQKGFTLLEVLISSTILLATIAMLTNQLFSFNRTASETQVRQSLEEQLRLNLKRIEQEVLPGARILEAHPDDATLVTNKNRLILQIPAFNNEGMITHVDGNARPDLLILSKETDTGIDPLGRRTGKPQPDCLRLTLEAYSGGSRKNITNQIIARNLMPSDNNGDYIFPTTVNSSEVTGMFRYFTASGIEETDPENYPTNAALVRIVLWAEEETGQKTITTRKETEVRLRNFQHDMKNDL
jgi:prepilin-type N-terminal cleavage/methylation domain-containing protein